MNIQGTLLRGASLAALLVSGHAHAQQALPTIDVGTGARRPVAAHAPAPAPRPAPVRVATPAPAPAPAPSPAPQPIRRAIPDNVPAVVESVTRQQIDKTVNTLTTAGMMKYMPSVLVRERFVGDRNGILQTRTNTPIAGAQNLVYADNILLSNLLGNTFSTAPRWGMVSPSEVERIDLIYGPFSALYPGNAMGGVMTITTRMPKGFEVHAAGTAAVQPFSLYGSKELNLAGDMNILAGHKINDFSFWLSYDRLDAQGQSQTFPGGEINGNGFANTTVPGVGPNVFGGFVDIDHNGLPRFVGGANGRDHNQQHMGKVKLDYELAPNVHATYQAGFWSMISDSTPTSYIRDRNGVPLFNTQSGSINVGAWNFPYINNPSHANASHLMQGLSLKSDTKGVFDYDLSFSTYNYLRDYNNQAARYGLLPNAAATAYTINPRGSNTNLTGSFWRTADARGIWRPLWTQFGKHEVSFGGHFDQYSLSQTQTNTNTHTDNFYHSIQAVNLGKTETKAMYVQDVWDFQPRWRMTVGGRQEFWDAYGGVNNTLGQNYRPGIAGWPPTLITPPTLPPANLARFSPKGALEWKATDDFTLRGSVGRYYRFPTVLELFQNVTGPSFVRLSNPQLKPESGTSYDLTGEYVTANVFNGLIGEARPRVSLFLDNRWNAIINQTDFTTGISVSQNSNVGKTVYRGVEGAVVLKDIYWKGLDFTGSATFTDARTVSNYQQPWTQGMQSPRVPRIRIRGVVLYSPNDELSLSFGVRYASAAFVSLANLDFNHNVYGNVDSEQIFFDAKASYKLSKEWTASVGVDNIGRWKAYVNPNPYQQRTFYFGLKYDLGVDQPTIAAFDPRSAAAADRGGSTGFGSVAAVR